MSAGVALLKDKEITREQGQFYGFAPHPALTGVIDWSRVNPVGGSFHIYVFSRCVKVGDE